jgi:hypothetical protein
VVVVVVWVELARDAVVADVTVNAQGACAVVLIDGNDEDELELDGTLNVGPEVGGGAVVVVAVGGAAGADPLNGDGGAAVVVGAAAPGGAVCAPAFIVVVSRTMPATAPRRSHRSGNVNVDRLGIIAGDP